MMLNLITLMIILSAFTSQSKAIFCKDECKESGMRCADAYTYQICVNMSDYAVGATAAKQCPDGTICTTEGQFPCIVGTVAGPTTAPPTTTLLPCSGPANFSASACNSYFECTYVWWWWEPTYRTCPDGENFEPSSGQCVPESTYNCGRTTTVAPAKNPECTGAGKLPGPTANQYYECEYIWFQWTPQLKTCPENEEFNEIALDCVAISQ